MKVNRKTMGFFLKYYEKEKVDTSNLKTVLGRNMLFSKPYQFTPFNKLLTLLLFLIEHLLSTSILSHLILTAYL